jgi:chromosome segregation ATPase
MAEHDPGEMIQEAPLKLVNFFNDLYKALRDKKQQEQMQQQQMANQEALQKQQQQFMAEQNERLMDVMQQSGIASERNNEVAKTGLTRLERLAETEVQTEQQIEVLEGQIAEIESEQQELLAGKVDQATETQAKIDDLDKQKQAAHEMTEMNKQLLNKKGLSPEELKKQTEALDQQKADLQKHLTEQRDELVKMKAGLDDPTKRLGELDDQLKQADDAFQQKSQDLMKKPGITPDQYFEGMEKLKEEKAGIVKGIEAEKDMLKKHQQPELSPKEKQDKLHALHEKKAEKLKTKGDLQEKMKGIQTEKTDIMQAKGMNLKGPQQGMGKGLGKGKGGTSMGTDLMTPYSPEGQLMCGGFDVGKKALEKPNSVAASLAKELQSAGKFVKEGLGQVVKAGKHLLK